MDLFETGYETAGLVLATVASGVSFVGWVLLAREKKLEKWRV